MHCRFVAAFLATLLLGMAGCGDGSTARGAGTPTVQAKGEKTEGATLRRENTQEPTEHFDPASFDRSTTIDNEWLPLKPGTRFVWEGTILDDEGKKDPHRVVFTVTDLTKVIGGVRTVVCWDQDFADDELVESEIVFFAQDQEGNVWHLGQYPEEYKEGEFVKAPCWLHGIKDGKAGIMMTAEPRLGTPSYSQGWAPSVNWTDRAVVYQVGQKTTVPFGSFEDALVIDETSKKEPNAHHLKYYARGVGNVRVGWRGEARDQEELELTKVETLSAEGLAEAREEALRLDKRAYENSKEMYAQTKPAEALGPATVQSRKARGDAAVANAAPAKSQVRKITEEKAKEIALKKVKGQVTHVGIEKKFGKNTYVVAIVTPDAEEIDVILDLETGKVLGTEK